jgi:hypothetical protein
MKVLTALLVAAALVAPAVAQNPVQQEIQKNHKGKVVTPAVKPVLLHTGKPITQQDKEQLRAAIVKTFKSKTPVNKGKTQQAAAPQPTLVKVSPSELFSSGVYTEMNQPDYVNISSDQIIFSPGESSSLDIAINVNANTTYILNFKVDSMAVTPQFTILPTLPSGAVNGAETFTGIHRNNEFAYALVSDSTGVINVTLYSSNAYWDFKSCEITATPVN